MTSEMRDFTERVTMIGQTGEIPEGIRLCYVQVTIILIIRARRHKSVANLNLALNKCRICSGVWQLTAAVARMVAAFRVIIIPSYSQISRLRSSLAK